MREGGVILVGRQIDLRDEQIGFGHLARILLLKNGGVKI